MRRSLILRTAGSGGVTAPPSVYDAATHLWKLDEASGSRAATKGGLALTDNNTVGYANIGPRGVVAKFTRANSERLKIGNQVIHPTGTVINEFTIEGWVKLDLVPSMTVTLVYIGHASGITIYTGAVGEIANVSLGWYDGSAYPSRSVNWGNHGDGLKWHHYAATFSVSGSLAKIFIDGVRRDDTGPHPTTGGNRWSQAGVYDDFTIGAIDGAGSNFMNGVMSRVRYYERALSDAEVLASYNAGRGLAHAAAPTGSLVVSADLDEVSGNRNGHGFTLVDVNTVTSVVPGPRGIIADFINADDDYLSHATVGRFAAGESRTWAFWYMDDSPGATPGALIARDNAATREWAIVTGNTQLQFLAFDGAGTPTSLDSITDFSDSFLKNQWHFIIFWFDSSTNTLNYRVDNGTARSKVTPGDIRGGTATTTFGWSQYYANADIRLARAGHWNAILSPAEQTSLFNAGYGKRYSELTAAEKVNLVSYWNLDEPSGARADSHGTNNLTDNNTVMSTYNGVPANLPGRVASFINANNEYLSRLSQTMFVAGQPRTLAMWLRPANGWIDAYAHNPQVFQIGNAMPDYGSVLGYIYIGGSSPNGYLHLSTNGTGTTGTGFLDDGSWGLLIYTIDGISDHRVYFDTIQRIARTAVDAGNANNFYIGNGTGGAWQGEMSVAAIFPTVLTSEQRAALWNNGDGAVLP